MTKAALRGIIPMLGGVARLNAGSGTSTNTDEESAVQSLIDKGLVEKVWEYRIAGKEPIYSSPIGPVTVLDGATPRAAVVFNAGDWYCYALNAATGALIWRKAAGAECYGRPQAADVNADGAVEIFFPSHDGKIWSITNTGANRWQFPSLYLREGSGNVTAASAYSITDNTKSWATNAFMRQTAGPFSENASVEILTGTGAGQIRMITQNNEGNKLWVDEAFDPVPDATSTYRINPKYNSDGIFMHAGTLVNEDGTFYLYATAFDNHVYKINATTGALVWKYATLENIEPYPLVWKDGATWRIVVVSVDGKTRMFNKDGGVVWQTNTGQCDAFVTLGPDGLFVSSRNNRVYRLDVATGAIEAESTNMDAWDYGDVDSSATPIMLNGNKKRVLVGGDAGALWCMDADLNTQWLYQAGPLPLNSSPVFHRVLGNNDTCAILGDMRGTVWCINIETGAVVGALFVKGGVEGTPYYGDIDGDGKAELIVTTTDGYVVCFRFLRGGVLTDSTQLPGNSKHRGFQGAELVVVPPEEPVGTTPHTHWRIYVTAVDGGAAVSIDEIEMRANPAGQDLCVGGSPSHSSRYDGARDSGYAFDNITVGGANFWGSAGPPPEWIAYAFLSPVAIDHIKIFARNDGNTYGQSPSAFKVQSSDDGVTWNDEWTVSGSTGWAAGEARSFARPAGEPANAWETLVASLDLELWLRGLETSGATLSDSSGNARHAELTINTALAQPPIYDNLGSSVAFSGGFARVPHAAGLSFATDDFIAGISFQVLNRAGGGQYAKLLWKTTGYFTGVANYLLQLGRSDGRVSARVSYAGSDYNDATSTTTFSDGDKGMVWIRRLGDEISVWVNGVKENAFILPAGQALMTSTEPVDIMGGPGNGTDPVLGKGDEIIIARGSVSDATMVALWNARQA
jgi:hypothetical protein